MAAAGEPKKKEVPLAPTTWIGVDLPGRPQKRFSTYSFFDVKELPPVRIDPRFANIDSIQAVQEHIGELNDMFRSPTACYFQVDVDSGIFFRDQQDCVLWMFHEGKGVHIDEEGKQVVAVTLPEFLTRVFIENEIWMKSNVHADEPLSEAEQRYVDAYTQQNNKRK